MRSTCLACVVAGWLACVTFPPVAEPAEPAGTQAGVESDHRMATRWWSELRKKWTPIGWKNHLFRYNVLFNGAIVAEPHMNRRTARWAGQGVLLWPSPANPADDGTVRQGWRKDREVPVLWTDWSVSAPGTPPVAVVRQEVFAHIPGADDVKTGIEPLFAWARVSTQAGPKAELPNRCEVSFKILAPAIGRAMTSQTNLRYAWAPYPRKLSLRPAAPGGFVMLLEADGKVRLAVAEQKGCKVDFRAAEKNAAIHLVFDAQPGAYADLLVPMIPTAQDVVETECRLGREKALAQADAYWRHMPATAATIDVPEVEVTEAIRHWLKMAEVIAEKDPATGEYCTLTGSWTYADVWSTPNSMLPALLLDPMGYHAQAERYLAVFRKHQGTTVPPGKAFKPHPGYLGTPKVYQAINWLTDNGALLWAFSQHALLSGDEKFIETYTPAILKSCEWIRDARRITGHGGVEGILPPAVATDEGRQVQSVWSDGWNYKGLTTAVRLLKKIKHPRAGDFEAEASDYRRQFRKALGEVAQKTPTWTDAAGKVRPMTPRSLSGDKDFGINHAFYLDGGPLFLVFSGLMDADDELIGSNRAWFREGPPRKTYQDNGNCWQTPSLHHELSSCEPCYSWVFFHSWQLGDRARLLEGMYSLFAGACSQQTYTVCETRGGITGVTPCLPCVWLARLAVIDDEIRPNELHLLRMVPLAWLRTDKEARFDKMPTQFGPVGLTARLAVEGRELQVTFAPKFRQPPQRIVLHIPPLKGLAAIRFNAKTLPWDGKQPSIEVP